MPRTIDSSLWMWAEACDLLAQAERLQRQFFRPGPSGTAAATWEPPADVYEDDHEIVVVIAMPGVTADRVQIVNEPGVLTVRGSRPLPLVSSRHLLRRMEIPHGRFECRVTLPLGRLALEPAELSHGCLLLRLRKTSKGLR